KICTRSSEVTESHNQLFALQFVDYVPAAGLVFFFFTAPATTQIYTLSLHDALPIYAVPVEHLFQILGGRPFSARRIRRAENGRRSEEHTSELQSPYDLVCRLLLEKKK